MARYRRRRYSRTRPVSRRQLEIVRYNGQATFSRTNAAFVLDLLPQGEEQYKKDLTPSTVAGVKGHFTWFTSNTSTTEEPVSPVILGVGLIDESRRQMEVINNSGDTFQKQISPLDPVGRYERWHYRAVRFDVAPGNVQDNRLDLYRDRSRQLADNKTSLRTKTRRKMHTVDDSYYMLGEVQGLAEGHSLDLYYELTIFLQKP